MSGWRGGYGDWRGSNGWFRLGWRSWFARGWSRLFGGNGRGHFGCNSSGRCFRLCFYHLRGLDLRLGWGIGVQRGNFDGFGGLRVGRGFWQRLYVLRRRVKGWEFQFGVQGCTLGFGIEEFCHLRASSGIPCTRDENCVPLGVASRSVAIAVNQGCQRPSPIREPLPLSAVLLQGTSHLAGELASNGPDLLGKHPAGNGWLGGGRNSLLESAQEATLTSVASRASPSQRNGQAK
jgi:hypothetical protein